MTTAVDAELFRHPSRRRHSSDTILQVHFVRRTRFHQAASSSRVSVNLLAQFSQGEVLEPIQPDRRGRARRRWEGDPLPIERSVAARLDDAFRDAARSADYRKPELFRVICEYVAAATRLTAGPPERMAVRLGAYARLSATAEGTSVARAEVEAQALFECCPLFVEPIGFEFMRDATSWRRVVDVPDPDAP